MIDINSVIEVIAKKRNSSGNLGRGNFGIVRPEWSNTQQISPLVFPQQQEEEPGFLGALASGLGRQGINFLNKKLARNEEDDEDEGFGGSHNLGVGAFRQYARGGKIKPGQIGLVGDGGNGDESDDELVVGLPEGGARVIPADKVKQIQAVFDRLANNVETSDAGITGEPQARPLEMTEMVQSQPTPQRSVVDDKYAEVQRLEQKDFSKKKNPAYDPKLPESETNQRYIHGKDRDKTKSVKDVFKALGLGALQGIANSRGGDLATVLGGALGGAASGGIAGAIDPNTDDRMMNEIKLAKARGEYDQTYARENQRKQDEVTREARRKQAEAVLTGAQTNAQKEKRLGDQWIAEKTGSGDRFAIGKRHFR